MKLLRSNPWHLAMALGVVVTLLGACGPSQPPIPGTSPGPASPSGRETHAPAAGAADLAVLAVFDVSESVAPAVRERYREDFQKVLTALAGHPLPVLVYGDRITDNTEATSSFPIHVTLPGKAGWMDVHAEVEKRKKEAVEQCEAGLDEILKTTSPQTDVLSAFSLAGKTLDPSTGTPHRYLLIFSDMIEQSSRYDFASEDLSPTGIEKIVQAQRQGGLPNLEGVKIWVIGAAAANQGGMPPERIREIEAFWSAYCAATGADFDQSRYASRLLHFQLPTK